MLNTTVVNCAFAEVIGYSVKTISGNEMGLRDGLGISSCILERIVRWCTIVRPCMSLGNYTPVYTQQLGLALLLSSREDYVKTTLGSLA